MTAAAMRGLLMALLIALPSLILPPTQGHSPELVTLTAILLGCFVFAEYFSTSPSFLEFRDARPMNRCRFAALAVCVFLVSLLTRHEAAPTGLTALTSSLGHLLAQGLDIAFSPVRLVQLVLPPDLSDPAVELARRATAMAYTASLSSVLVFGLIIRTGRWPQRNGPFNVWINLPLFDPTTGGDVVTRLQRDARLHIAGGVLAPFLLPAMVKLGSGSMDPALFANAQLFVWAVTGWAMFPAMMIMRGMARLRVAELIAVQRRSFALDDELQTA
ncbi:hypothetical protein [Tritonibacter multivorans]|nr:hypothetical protein [Tritonibacter multivorans]MDA7422538.1 hypothetical protein [Tritonibacter multivorans]